MLGAMFGLGFILGPVMGGLLGAHRPAPAVLRRRLAGARSTCSTAGSCCPNRCRPNGAGRSPGARRSTRSPRSPSSASSAASACWSAVVALRGTVAVHPLHQLGALHDLQVRLGPAAERLVAVRRRLHVGAGPGSPARPAAEALLAAAPGDRRPGLVDARLRRLGRGDRGLDDLRGDPLQRPRLHRRGVDPEHHLERRRPDDAGPDDGRGELAAKPDGGASRRSSARRCSAWSRTCRAATGASARRSTSAPWCS